MISSTNEESIYKVCLFTYANRLEVEMNYQMIQNLQQNKKHELILKYTSKNWAQSNKWSEEIDHELMFPRKERFIYRIKAKPQDANLILKIQSTKGWVPSKTMAAFVSA